MKLEAIHEKFAEARSRKKGPQGPDDYTVSSERLLPVTTVEPPVAEYRPDSDPEPVVGGLQLDPAHVTINRYDAAILNTPNLCCVDIDEPVADAAMALGTSAFYTTGQWLASSIFVPLAASTGTSWLLYRTYNGYRALLVSKPLTFAQDSALIGRLLACACCDPLYARLCYEQCNFRIRLEPKPWRQDEYQVAWLRNFISPQGETYCPLLEDISDGTGNIHPLLREQVLFHDRLVTALCGQSATY